MRLLALVVAALFALASPATADPYADANAAFQAGDFDGAVALAARAAREPGPHRIDARILYGDALFRRGDVVRARDIYQALLQPTSGEQHQLVQRKLALANARLAPSSSAPSASSTPPTRLAPGAATSRTTTRTTARDSAYARARIALDTGDAQAALELAAEAARAPGPHRFDARLLYGDALARLGETRRAHDVFLALRALAPADQRDAVEQRITATAPTP